MSNVRLAALMMMMLIVASRAVALDLETARMVDLTHPFDEQTIYWPTARSFTMWPVAHGHTPGGWWYAANDFCAAEHGGTHLDAPIHFSEQGATVDAVPLSQLGGPAVVVDISERAAKDPDTMLEVADLEHGAEVRAGSVVLVRTGWDRWWSDRATYLGTATPGDTAHLHFPGIAPSAAEWLVARKVHAVGIDTASIDRGQSTDFQSHQVFGRANVPTFENLAGLDALPPRGAFFLGLPMKIRGGSGAPLRAVAFLP